MAIGRHPNEADRLRRRRPRRAAGAGRARAVRRDRRDRASTTTATSAPRADQERAFQAQIELARETGKPLVIHTRAAEDDTLSTAGEHAAGLRVILHCFSMADRIEECLAHPDWWISFAGNVTYPSAASLRAAALRVPAERLLVETDAPYLAPQPVRGTANEPAYVVAHRPGAGARAAGRLRRARAGGRAQRRGAVRMVSSRRTSGPRPELPRRPQHPRRDRAPGAARTPTTSCSRSAAAWACSPSASPRAPRTCTWSRSTSRLEPALRDALEPFDERHAALRRRDGARPRRARAGADKVVANLPYGIAATRDPAHDRGAAGGAALGRDGAARGRRAARRGARGRRLRRARRCSRSSPARCACCAPSPAPCSARCPTSTRCWSGLSGARPRPSPTLRALVHAAFAHRRKALARFAGAGAGRSGRCPRAGARGAGRRSATRPTSAPSASRRRSSGPWRARPAPVTELRQRSRRARSTSACCSAGPGPTGATSS